MAFANLERDLVHAVILVRTSGGEKFVLDPTGEQHGVLREHRFLPWTAYKDLYVMKQMHWIGRATFSYALDIEEIVDRTAEESEAWSFFKTIVHVTTDQWLAVQGQFNLLERIKGSIGPPWVKAPLGVREMDC
jgi:hypothetical protein